MKINKFPEPLVKLRDQFLDHRRYKMNRSKSRLQQIKASINYLYEFMVDKGIAEIPNLTQTHIIKFQYFMYQIKYHTAYSTVRHMDNLNIFCRYLYHNNLIWKNPFNGIKYISPPELEKMQIKRYYSFNELTRRWTNDMRKRGIIVDTVNDKIKSIGIFINFLESKGFKTIYKITPETIEEYKQFLSNYQYEPNRYYNPFTQVLHLRWACQFLLYLHRERLIKQDPSKYVNLRQHYKELENQTRKEHNPDYKRREIRIDNPEIKSLLEKFIQYHLSRGGSIEGVRNYILAIEKFHDFIKIRGITDLHRVTKRDLMDFQIWLTTLTSVKGTKYAPSSLSGTLISLRSFFRYLVRYDYLTCDHSSLIELPRNDSGIQYHTAV